MTVLHVVPDERGGWFLLDETRHHPLSTHRSATDAERSAWTRVRAPGPDDVVVHDRYGRTRRAVRFGDRSPIR